MPDKKPANQPTNQSSHGGNYTNYPEAGHNGLPSNSWQHQQMYGNGNPASKYYQDHPTGSKQPAGTTDPNAGKGGGGAKTDASPKNPSYLAEKELAAAEKAVDEAEEKVKKRQEKFQNARDDLSKSTKQLQDLQENSQKAQERAAQAQQRADKEKNPYLKRQLQEEADRARSEASEIEKSLKATQNQNEANKKAYEEAETKLKNANDVLTQRKTQLSGVQDDHPVDAAGEAVDKAEERCKKKDKALEKAKEQQEKADKKYDEALDKLGEAQETLDKAKEDLKNCKDPEQKKELKQAVEDAQDNVDTLSDKAEKARDNADKKKKNVENAEAEKKKADENLKAKNDALNEAKNRYPAAGAWYDAKEAQDAADAAKDNYEDKQKAADKAAEKQKDLEKDYWSAYDDLQDANKKAEKLRAKADQCKDPAKKAELEAKAVEAEEDAKKAAEAEAAAKAKYSEAKADAEKKAEKAEKAKTKAENKQKAAEAAEKKAEEVASQPEQQPLKVGQKVQIKNGGMDVTNGKKARAKYYYGEGGPYWATITKIVPNWPTGGRWGLPKTVTKVVCSNGGTVVWQVQPQDIAGQVISNAENKESPKEAPKTDKKGKSKKKVPPQADSEDNLKRAKNQNPGASNKKYAPKKKSSNWAGGKGSIDWDNRMYKTGSKKFKNPDAWISDSMFSKNANAATLHYTEVDPFPERVSDDPKSPDYWKFKHQKDYIPDKVLKLGYIYKGNYLTSWANSGRRRELLNRDASLIQNNEGYPAHLQTNRHTNGKKHKYALVDTYDWRVIPNDWRYRRTQNMENQLAKFRAQVGLMVHGDNNVARSVKFYDYNRFKVPDTNLAHSRTFTHIFFTRPDLYLLNREAQACPQVMNHTDTALLWRQRPELFKLLTDYRACGDTNNFNMLLSNQVQSFQLSDETLEVIRAGRSWSNHEMSYAEQYAGRTAGEFTCTFAETSEYSVLHLIKLWMTYIDNVSRGAWSPNYDDSVGSHICHVHDRALDYAASMYVFKCGPDGEEILYWSKYYGIFPITSGASSLSYDMAGNGSMDTPRLSINFAYSYKKDMSPISLLEFNHVANVNKDEKWVPGYDWSVAGSARPFVGAPYVELYLGNTSVTGNDVHRANRKTSIRLKFRPDTYDGRSDDILYRPPFQNPLWRNELKNVR